MKKLNLILFRLGVLNALIVALYHFYLPYQFSWLGKMQQTPPIFSWSLMTINFDWSLLTALVSLALLLFSLKPEKDATTKQQLCGVFIIYWMIHTIYLFISPAPLPDHLIWLNYVFAGFGVMTNILLMAGLRVFKT